MAIKVPPKPAEAAKSAKLPVSMLLGPSIPYSAELINRAEARAASPETREARA